MKLLGTHTMIFGKKKEGKSNFLQYALSQEKHRNALLYDVCREHEAMPDGIRYLPEYRNGEKARAELGGVIDRFVTGNDRERRPDLLVMEEVSRLAPNGGGSPDELYDVVDLNRHYGMGVVGVARRPAQVETTLVELADHIVVFYVDGPNDIRKLNNLSDGLGDAANELDKYHYIVASGRDWQEYKPVREMDTTGEL